ncbi:site-specific integrase [Pseudoxanthomonas sp. Root630]|uniref:site-specific integrase n=1 Tax=Pseudoxanthomonas sp. Root630 TaxID=1736574 RepID=UPI0031B61318
MPKPLLLSRPSGLYVRFLVPTDLRAVVGSRFLVRALHVPSGDAARLVAAHMAVALSVMFKALRAGKKMDDTDIAELLRKAANGDLQDLILKGVKLSDGTSMEEVRIDTPQDATMFAEILRRPASRKAAVDEGAHERGERRREQMRQSSARLQAQAPPQEDPISVLARVPRKKRLSGAIARHLRALKHLRRLEPNTIMESRHTLRILLGVVGDMPASSLNVDHAREVMAAVEHWPKNATQVPDYRGLSVKEIVRLSKENKEPRPALRTLKKHWDRLNVFTTWLTKQGLLQHNPMGAIEQPSEHTIDAEAESRRPFSHEELKAVFGPAFSRWAAKWPHRYWGVVLGLYSGARVAEVAQLSVADVLFVEDVPGYVITHKIKGNKVKNPSSKRFVPMAQPVIDAGFLGYVEEVRAAGLTRLFPNLPGGNGLSYGRQLSRQFSAFIKTQGIDEPGMGFHALRHYLVTHLDRTLQAQRMKLGDRNEAIGRITGHYKIPDTTLRNTYVDERGLPIPSFVEPETLSERVATLALFSPPVEIPAYIPGQFAGQLKEAAAKKRRAERQETEKPKAKSAPKPGVRR